jgi:hypothetical protein
MHTFICCVLYRKDYESMFIFFFTEQIMFICNTYTKNTSQKNKAKTLVIDILCQQWCIKEQCIKYKQRERQSIKFLHMPLMMTVIFNNRKPKQNKPIFNCGGGVNAQCGLLFSPDLKMCIYYLRET